MTPANQDILLLADHLVQLVEAARIVCRKLYRAVEEAGKADSEVNPNTLADPAYIATILPLPPEFDRSVPIEARSQAIKEWLKEAQEVSNYLTGLIRPPMTINGKQIQEIEDGLGVLVAKILQIQDNLKL